MEIVRKKARDFTGADGATFVLREGDMCYYADEEAISPLWKGSRFPMSACISGWSMKHQKAAVIEDIEEDPRIPQEVYRPTFVKSMVMVPIRGESPLGAIGNYWAEQHDPSEEEVELLSSLAHVTAVAMENVYLQRDLEKKVQERTASLEAFSYSIAHDLKNPLAGMEMRLNSLEADRENMNEEFQEVTSDLRGAIKRMQGMIDGLLHLSQLGNQGVQKEWSDMERMVRDIVERTQEEEGGQHVSFRIHPLSKELLDPTLFQRVWENLISNAIKFCRGRPEPLIEIGMDEQKSKRIYWIKDNGWGFAPDKEAELFKAFKTLSTDQNLSGSGIGLSTVKQIIYKHGGEIWAEGEPGKGACFFFSLPWFPEDEAIASSN